MRSRWLIVTVVAAALAGRLPAEPVGVPGSSTKYSDVVETTVNGKTVKLVLTGTAMRTKFLFNVYTIGSYVAQGASARTAEQLAAADCPKRLHLVMERAVDGKDMAEAFRAAIRLNHAEPALNDEVNSLVQFMRATSVKKDDHVVLTHVPGVGLECLVAGKTALLIKNVPLAHAVWEIYLGKNNLGDGIKKGLMSRR